MEVTKSYFTFCMNCLSQLQVNDTIMLDLETGKIKDFIKFDIGQLCMATGGHNRGRVGTIVSKEKHKGSFDIVLVRDAAGQEFATRYRFSPEIEA